MSAIANQKYAYTREGSSVFFTETEKIGQPGDNGHIGVKVAASPNTKFVTVGVVITVVSLAIICAITVAVVILTQTANDNGATDPDMTTLPLPQSTQPTASSSSGSSVSTDSATLDTTRGSSSTYVTTSTGSTTTVEQSVVTWLPWNVWLSCSVTCGSGIHRRYRSCSDGASICEGDYIETAVCTETPCPVYGKWTTWASWGSCTSSCGGGIQLRTRSCNKADSSDLECVGNVSQNKTCSNWNCPDCSQDCSPATLNPECDTCICENNIVTGRVVSNRTNTFLSNAFVYASTAPTTMLTQTNTTGHFTLNTTCMSTQLLIVSEGFVDTTVTIDSNNVEVRMTKIAFPYFTQTPRSKYRLTGETVTMCCTAMATPGIDYYEWFKDSLWIETVESTDGTMITLQDLTPSDSGNYQCRANSPNGAVMSPVTKIYIKDNPDDFCENALQQKVVSLPDGCEQPDTNSTLYEVGECVAHSCRLNESNTEGSCRDETHSCCVMSEADIRTVQCTNYDIQVFVIRACGCAKCLTPSLKISGTVVDFEDNSPVKFAQVWVNGVFKTFTSGTGSFSFKPSNSVDQINIFINDTFLQQYLSTTKVVKISPEMTGTLHIEIKLFKASDPVELDSAEGKILVVGTTEGGSAIVQVHVPSNAFYNVDGTPYNGVVSASLTFLDPTNITVLENIPGLFEFTDAEGQPGALDSYGVFNLYFRDSNGQPLVLDATIDLYAPNDMGTGDENQEIKLWRLNAEAGIWDYVTSRSDNRRRRRRRRRQALSTFIGSINPNDISEIQWWNYDRVRKEGNGCYFKIRLFEEETLKTTVRIPPSRVYVQSVTLSNSKMRIIKDYFYNPEERCISAICDNMYAHIFAHVYQRNIQKDLYVADPYLANSNNEYEITSDNKILKFKMAQSTKGPLFESLDVCLNSSPADPHVIYHYGITNEDWEAVTTFTQIGTDIPALIEASRMTWYPKRTEGYRVCYLKVRLEFWDSNIFEGKDLNLKLRATSFSGSDVGMVYGVRVVNIRYMENKTVCIEYKCSGLVDPVFVNEEIDYTRVKLEFDHPTTEMNCTMTSNTDLVQDAYQNGTGGEFTAPIAGGSNTGVFYATSDVPSLTDADKNANKTCHTGEGVSGADDPFFGVGVTFTCRLLNDNYWYWIWWIWGR